MSGSGCDIIEDTPVKVVCAVAAGRKVLCVGMGFASGRQAVAYAMRLTGMTKLDLHPNEAGRQLREYFAGIRREFDLEPVLGGVPPFHAEVLRACEAIGYGRLSTYGALAAAAGSPKASRAAGAALAQNPVGIIIPCHRVVSKRGPGGFSASGGLATKFALLDLEGIDTNTLSGAGR